MLSPDGSTEVGKISKQWSGLLREAFTDSDNFGIRDEMSFFSGIFFYFKPNLRVYLLLCCDF